MPQIDLAQQRRDVIAKAREHMRATYRRGTFITLDAAPSASVLVADGRQIRMRPLDSDEERKAREAEAKAREDRASRAFVDKHCYW